MSVEKEFEWKLHNFTRTSISFEDASYIDSDEFTILLGSNETKWKFSAIVKNSELSIFLRLQKYDSKEFSVKFALWVQNKKNLAEFKLLKAFNPNDYRNGSGFEKFIKIDEIFDDSENFLQNDVLTLRAKIKLCDNPATQEMDAQDNESNKYLTDIKLKFSELLDSKFKSDVTIVLPSGKNIFTHSIILATNCSVLSSMIKAVKDKPENRKIKINDIDEETMTEIVRFIYTREVRNIDTLVSKLLYGAKKFELKLLMDICAEHLIKNLDINNAIDYFITAKNYELNDLFTYSMFFIDLNYHKIRVHKNWEKIDVNLAVSLTDFKDRKRVHVLDSLIANPNYFIY